MMEIADMGEVPISMIEMADIELAKLYEDRSRTRPRERERERERESSRRCSG